MQLEAFHLSPHAPGMLSHGHCHWLCDGAADPTGATGRATGHAACGRARDPDPADPAVTCHTHICVIICVDMYMRCDIVYIDVICRFHVISGDIESRVLESEHAGAALSHI